MSNPNPKTEQLKPFQWHKGQSGNPDGMSKGTKHLSTHIQEMLHTEIDFKVLIQRKGKNSEYQTFQGLPIRAIIAVAIHQSMLGDKDAREWLARHGYGTKIKIDSGDPVEEVLRMFGLIEGDTDHAEQAEDSTS